MKKYFAHPMNAAFQIAATKTNRVAPLRQQSKRVQSSPRDMKAILGYWMTSVSNRNKTLAFTHKFRCLDDHLLMKGCISIRHIKRFFT